MLVDLIKATRRGWDRVKAAASDKAKEVKDAWDAGAPQPGKSDDKAKS